MAEFPPCVNVQRAAGINAPYVSKLDEFEQFIQHAKLGMLPLHSTTTGVSSHVGGAVIEAAHAGTTTTQPAAAQHILLIEDLPFCADAQQQQKLTAMLGRYRVKGSCCTPCLRLHLQCVAYATLPTNSMPKQQTQGIF